MTLESRLDDLIEREGTEFKSVRASIATKAADADLDAHVADTNNPHGVTKTQVGLARVQNVGVWVLGAAEARPAGVQTGDIIFRKPT